MIGSNGGPRSTRFVDSAERRGVRLRAPFEVGEVGVPEPRHPLRGEEVALRELLVRLGVHGGVGHRVPHRLLHEADVAALVGH